MARPDGTIAWSAWKRALLDGLAVLAAILLAFGIDAWWDSRNDAIRGEEYREALVREVELNRALLEAQGSAIESNVEHIDRIFREVVHAPGAVEEDALMEVVLGDGLGPFTVARPQQGAVMDILASAGLGYLEDPGTRRLLAVYRQSLDVNVEWQQAIQSHWEDAVARYLGAHLGLPDLLSGDFGAPAMKLGGFPVDRQAFVRNRDFANLLTHRAFLLANLRSSREDLLGTLEEARRALEPGG